MTLVYNLEQAGKLALCVAAVFQMKKNPTGKDLQAFHNLNVYQGNIW